MNCRFFSQAACVWYKMLIKSRESQSSLNFQIGCRRLKVVYIFAAAAGILEGGLCE